MHVSAIGGVRAAFASSALPVRGLPDVTAARHRLYGADELQPAHEPDIRRIDVRKAVAEERLRAGHGRFEPHALRKPTEIAGVTAGPKGEDDASTHGVADPMMSLASSPAHDRFTQN
jgi:hypothetical protein